MPNRQEYNAYKLVWWDGFSSCAQVYRDCSYDYVCKATDRFPLGTIWHIEPISV